MTPYGLTPFEAWWFNCLFSGELLSPDLRRWAQKPPNEPWPELVGSKALYVSYVIWSRANGIKYYSDVEFARDLTRVVGKYLVRRKSRGMLNPRDNSCDEADRVSNHQNEITNFPYLRQARKTFEEVVLQKKSVRWPPTSEREYESFVPKNRLPKVEVSIPFDDGADQ